MKNTLRKLLITAGICTASTSAFATNYFTVEVDNLSAHKTMIVNWDQNGSNHWDNDSNMHGVVTINSHQTSGKDASDSYTWGGADVKYFSINVPDPKNPNIGKRVVFFLANTSTPFIAYGANYSTQNGQMNLNDGDDFKSHKVVIKYDGDKFQLQTYNLKLPTNIWKYDSTQDLSIADLNGFQDSLPVPSSPGPGASTIRGCSNLPQWDSSNGYGDHTTLVYNNKVFENRWYSNAGVNPTQRDSNGSMVWAYQGDCGMGDGKRPIPTPSPTPSPSVGGDCSGVAQWDSNKTYDTPGQKVIYNNVEYTNQWWTKGDSPATNSDGVSKVWKTVYKCSNSVALNAIAQIAEVPTGTYNFGQWKAGEYPVVYSPKEVHPFVTYNGKGYVACNGDTTAKDIPGQSDAWKEVNGSLSNTCGVTIHSYKKQSTTPAIVKTGVAFW